MHDGFVKATKILLDSIIGFILSPTLCGFKGCLLLDRRLLLLPLCFPCGTHTVPILQRNKCILTIKCHALLLELFLNVFYQQYLIQTIRYTPSYELRVIEGRGVTEDISTFWVLPIQSPFCEILPRILSLFDQHCLYFFHRVLLTSLNSARSLANLAPRYLV